MASEINTYRAGIIGLGFIGAADQVSGDALGQQVTNLDGTHFGAYSGNDRVEIVAGSSRDSGRRSRFEAKCGATTYADWRHMIDEVDLDIVSIATYTPVHEEIAVACAERGIRAIYCEKPIARTLSEADRMIEGCKAADSLLVINHNRRFNPNLRRLRTFIAGDGIGKLSSVTTIWGTGRLGNVGTHVFDAVRMITGREAVSVSGTLDRTGRPDCRGPEFNDPGGWGVVAFEEGIMCTVDAADSASVPMLLRFDGTTGVATVRGRSVSIEKYGYPDDQECWPNDPADVSSMDIAVSEIVEWLDGGGSFAYPGPDSLGTFETIVGFHASDAKNGAWVDLPLTGANREIVVNSG